MKIKSLMIAVFAFALLIFTNNAQAAEYGTKEEAVKMATKAAEALDANETDAIKKIHEKGGDFHNKDLYVGLTGKDGIIKAHGAKPILVGKSGLNLKDVDGKAFIKEMLEIKDTGWVKYKWPDAQAHGAIKEKTTYVIKRSNGDIISVGFYEKP